MTPTDAEHLPDRATWDCGACGAAWPCEPARSRLLATMDSASLGVYAAAQLFDAVAHLPGVSPAELWTRFLGWIRTEAGRHPGRAGPATRPPLVSTGISAVKYEESMKIR